MKHEDFMKMAIALSIENVEDHVNGPFGAVVVKDGRVVGASANKVVTSNDPTAHAEVAAIRLACKELDSLDLSGCIIYTSCEPCPMCLGAIYWAQIETIYYANSNTDAAEAGFDDQFIYAELKKPLSERKLPIKQLMRDEAIKAFKLW